MTLSEEEQLSRKPHSKVVDGLHLARLNFDNPLLQSKDQRPACETCEKCIDVVQHVRTYQNRIYDLYPSRAVPWQVNDSLRCLGQSHCVPYLWERLPATQQEFAEQTADRQAGILQQTALILLVSSGYVSVDGLEEVVETFKEVIARLLRSPETWAQFQRACRDAAEKHGFDVPRSWTIQAAADLDPEDAAIADLESALGRILGSAGRLSKAATAELVAAQRLLGNPKWSPLHKTEKYIQWSSKIQVLLEVRQGS